MPDKEDIHICTTIDYESNRDESAACDDFFTSFNGHQEMTSSNQNLTANTNRITNRIQNTRDIDHKKLPCSVDEVNYDEKEEYGILLSKDKIQTEVSEILDRLISFAVESSEQRLNNIVNTKFEAKKKITENHSMPQHSGRKCGTFQQNLELDLRALDEGLALIFSAQKKEPLNPEGLNEYVSNQKLKTFKVFNTENTTESQNKISDDIKMNRSKYKEEERPVMSKDNITFINKEAMDNKTNNEIISIKKYSSQDILSNGEFEGKKEYCDSFETQLVDPPINKEAQKTRINGKTRHAKINKLGICDNTIVCTDQKVMQRSKSLKTNRTPPNTPSCPKLVR